MDSIALELMGLNLTDLEKVIELDVQETFQIDVAHFV